MKKKDLKRILYNKQRWDQNRTKCSLNQKNIGFRTKTWNIQLFGKCKTRDEFSAMTEWTLCTLNQGLYTNEERV